MSDSVRPHKRQPARLPRPWDSPGKNTGVGCHFLLQCMKVKNEREVAQSCLIPSDPIDCSLPGFSIHGIFQARVLEWGAITFSNYLGLNINSQASKLQFHFSFSFIGEGNGNPLQCSCLENPRDGGAWWAAISGVTQSRTQLKRLSSSNSSS